MCEFFYDHSINAIAIVYYLMIVYFDRYTYDRILYALTILRFLFEKKILEDRILSNKRSYIDPYFWQNDHSLFDHTFNHDCKLHYP